MDSILSHVVILKSKLVQEDDFVIQEGEFGYIITKAYLENSNIPPNNFKGLLWEAEQAKRQGLLYVDFKRSGKFAAVSPDRVLWK